MQTGALVAYLKHLPQSDTALPHSCPHFWQVERMDDQRQNRTTKHHLIGFALAGGLAFVVDAVVYTVFAGFGLSPAVARIPSITAAIMTTWFINRRWTFQTRTQATFAEFAKYAGAMGVGLVVNYSVFLFAIHASEIVQSAPVIGLALATGAAMVINFVSARFLLNR